MNRRQKKKYLKKQNSGKRQSRLTSRKIDAVIKKAKQIRASFNKDLSFKNKYDAYMEMEQYKNNKRDLYNVSQQFLKEYNDYLEHDLKFIAKMTAAGWDEDKAEKLHDLVSTDIYSMFRQKFHPPSDYYDLFFDDFDAADVEKAMKEMLESDSKEIQDLASTDVVNYLYDMLITNS